MGRRKASEHGLAPGIFVRLPLLQNYHVRRMVRPKRPLGVIMRELILEALKHREENTK